MPRETLPIQPGDWETVSQYFSALGGVALTALALKDFVNDFGAIADGATDNTAAVKAMVAYLNGGDYRGCYVRPGVYRVNDAGANIPAINSATCAVVTAGQNVAVFDYRGSGTFLACHQSPWNPHGATPLPYEAGPRFIGIRIDGSNAGAGAIGFELGDVNSAELDVAVQHFNGVGSIGARFNNLTNQMERCRGLVQAVDCTTGVVFTRADGATASFEHNDLKLILSVGATQTGLFFDGTNTVVYNNGGLTVRGNITQPGTLIQLTGTAQVTDNLVHVTCDDNAVSGATFLNVAGTATWRNYGIHHIPGTCLVSGAIEVDPLSNPLAIATGLLAFNFNPAATGTGSSPTSQRGDVAAIYLPPGIKITNVVLNVITAGSGTAPTGFFVAICSPTKMLAQSADLHASASLTTLGSQNFALSAPYVTNATDSPSGIYYVMLLENGAFATTNVAFLRGNASTTGSGPTRPFFGNIGTALATPPANGTAVSVGTGAGLGWFVGVS
jgi:hypothetical protein